MESISSLTFNISEKVELSSFKPSNLDCNVCISSTDILEYDIFLTSNSNILRDCVYIIPLLPYCVNRFYFTIRFQNRYKY